MKLKKLHILSIIAVLEALIILCLSFVFVSHTIAPPKDISSSYAGADLAAFWPEEKLPFAQRNKNYLEKEALYMTFQPSVELVCFGDSITQKFEWADALPGIRVANRGIGSDTTKGMLARVDSVAALSPRVISLMAGINDLVSRTPDETIVSYRALLTALRQQLPDTQIIVTSVLPVSESHVIPAENIIALNTMLKPLCAEFGIIYLDLFSEFADEAGNLRPEYDLDTVHLTAEGYSLWLSKLAPALAASLNLQN